MAAFGAYLALACLLYWPALPWNDVRLPSVPFGGFGFGDPAVVSWFLAWTPYALGHGLNPLYSHFLDAPQGVNLASNTSVPALGVVASPITVTLGPVAAFNVLLRLAFCLSAGSMYLVLTTWCRRWIAFVGGLLFGFSPYVVAQSTHLNLAFLALLPALVWLLYDLVVARQLSTRKCGLWLGVVAGLQVLIDPELLALLTAVCVPGIGILVALDGRRWRTRLAPMLRASPWTLGAFAFVAGYYLFWLFIGLGHVSGPPQPTASLQSYQTDLLAPVVPTLNQWLLPRALATVAGHFASGDFTENDGYLGVGLIAYVSVMAIRFRRHRLVLFSSLAALAALILSLGRRLTIDGKVTGIPLPEALLAHFPIYSHVVPSRFACVVILFTTIAAAVGTERYIESRRTKPARHSLDSVAITVIGLVALALVFPQIAQVTKAPRWPAGVYRALHAVPQGAIVLAYPYPADPYTEAMSWQSQDTFAFRLLGGYVDTPGPDGVGTVNPPMLAPGDVQGFFMDALYGHPLLYPPPSQDSNLRADLCRFVRRHDVEAIIYWRTGLHPQRVRDLISSDYGSPSASSNHGAIAVWVTSSTPCEAN